jgi:hypothetical protein
VNTCTGKIIKYKNPDAASHEYTRETIFEYMISIYTDLVGGGYETTALQNIQNLPVFFALISLFCEAYCKIMFIYIIYICMLVCVCVFVVDVTTRNF